MLVDYLLLVKLVNTTPASVEEWLNEIGLVRYWPAFRDNGFDFMGVISGLTGANLDLLGVALPGHHQHLLNKAKEIVLSN